MNTKRLKFGDKKIKPLASILLMGTLAGCSLLADKGTIGGIANDPQDEVKGGLDFSNMDHQHVRNEYQELLELVDDQYMKEQIQRRIAGVYMQEGDDNSTKLTAAPKQGYYRDAIQSYVDILEKYPNSPDNAEVLYQLAKAYDMEGQTRNALRMLERLADRHPYYTNISEAYFRMGDIYFNQQRYAKAEYAYRQTTEMDGGKLSLNSHYMLGWALYKQGKYNKGLDSFAYVLDELLMAEHHGRVLSKTERPLIDDTLHSITLALVNSTGAEGIEDVSLLDGKFYLWRVYQNLGDYYLEKQRFTDSASTYRRYVEEYEQEARAPEFYNKLIDAYYKGGFPKEVLESKEGFVSAYGITSDYWVEKGLDVQQTLKPYLKTYLSELAKYYHGQGQLEMKESQKFAKAKKASESAEAKDKAIAHLDRAIAHYDEFIKTFPKDNVTANMVYMKADALFLSGRFGEGATSYESVAYQYKDTTLQNKAGYAAIVSYQKQVQALKSEDDDDHHIWQEKAVASMLQFAEVFNEDKRSPAVLTNAAEYLFGLNQYEKAIQIAKNLLASQGDLPKTLQETAYGIIAHSYFQLGNYQLAENNYFNQRKLVSKKSSEYQDISQRIAASIFKKAEGLRAINHSTKAVNQLLRIKTIAPQSNIKVLAQYDAATILISLKRWDKALVELKDLKKKHSDHELAVEFPRKIAFVYEQTKRWKEAANAYLALHKNDPDPAVQEEALFISAGLFRKTKDYKQSITHFRDYAHKYEQPFDNRMEARFNLAELYDLTKEKSKHLFWLRRIIDGDKKGGDQRTDRSRWLGAWANAKYGDYFAWEFSRRKLRQPIEVSLPKKNKHLQDASKRYEMAAEYGILEFIAMSSYKIADLYETFANELRKSPRPKGMSSADKKLYETIIEEQAGPFMELATNIHQSNIDRSWEGYFNEWIEKSYGAMKRLQPERFNKSETVARYGDEIR